MKLNLCVPRWTVPWQTRICLINSLEAGMDGHIAKPIVMDEVVKAITRNLGR